VPRESNMPAINLRLGAFSAALALLAATSSGALAQKKYDVGASDTEIKIGQTMPYSGPTTATATIGKAHAAYFEMISHPSYDEYWKTFDIEARHALFEVPAYHVTGWYDLEDTYVISGNTLPLANNELTTYDYCVQGNMAHLIVGQKHSVVPYEGDIVLARQ